MSWISGATAPKFRLTPPTISGVTWDASYSVKARLRVRDTGVQVAEYTLAWDAGAGYYEYVPTLAESAIVVAGEYTAVFRLEKVSVELRFEKSVRLTVAATEF